MTTQSDTKTSGDMKTFVVIMAGGSGERFWPYSRIKHPKQLLRLTSPDKSMIEEAIERIEPLTPRENILVITSEVLRQPIVDAVNLPAENIIAEPAKRNTAPCLALAASVIKQRCIANGETDAVMAVLTADHFIGDANVFRKNVGVAVETAQNNDVLVTLGITPTRPETGYGYIEKIGKTRGLEDGKTRGLEDGRTGEAVPVVSFREKPNMELAMEFVASGNFLWNSGMFFWRVSVLEQAMLQHLPEVGACISNYSADAFKMLPDISIDYGIMEKASNVFVVPATFPWDDVGSWDALDRLRHTSEQGNIEQGRIEILDTTKSIIFNATTNNAVVSVLGLENVIVVVTDDAILVADKQRAQDVKKIVGVLRVKGGDDVL